MELEGIFKNLKPVEFDQASTWYESLKEPEQWRISETLQVLDRTQFYIDDETGPKLRPMAVIIAGSSIDSKTYKDIDLFLLSETSLHRDTLEFRTHPKTYVKEQIHDKLPDGVAAIIYRETDFDDDLDLTGTESVLGAKVTVSLFYELVGFDKRRTDKPDDLLEPAEHLSSEEIIRFNHEQRSKFLVLSRQYAHS